MDELQRMAPAACDYARCEQIWRRVAPELEPYADAPEGGAGELSLPGAQSDPCCMGSAARDEAEVIRGFAESEWRSVCRFSRLARRAGDKSAAAVLGQIAAAAREHLRQLRSAYYLAMGTCCPRSRSTLWGEEGSFCEALRRGYHEVACTGFNYLRAADETGDLCLRRLYRAFGEEEMARAEQILQLLGKRM